MNFQLANINSNETTMSSREIAELTSKRHTDVLRDIKVLLVTLYCENKINELVANSKSGARKSEIVREYSDYLLKSLLNEGDANWRHRINCVELDDRGYVSLINLDYEHTMTLVSGYDIKLRNAIIKRWQELEAQVKPAFALPQTFAQALALAAQQALELEQKQLQLEAAKPKVDYVDNYVDRNHLKSVTDTAKELGVSGKALGKWLREEGHAWSKHSSLRWTQPFIDKGYGEMKQYTSAGGFDGTQALVTASGDLFIKQNFSK